MTQEKRRRAYDDTTVNDVKGRNADGIFHVKAGRPLREAVEYLAEKKLARFSSSVQMAVLQVSFPSAM